MFAAHSTPASADAWTEARRDYARCVRRFYHQLTVGCAMTGGTSGDMSGASTCTHRLCRSSPTGIAVKLRPDQAALMAMQLASRAQCERFMCSRCPLQTPVVVAATADTATATAVPTQHATADTAAADFIPRVLATNTFQLLLAGSDNHVDGGREPSPPPGPSFTGVLRRAAKSLVDVSQLIRSSSVDALRAATAAEARPSISEEFIGVKAAAAVSAATAAAPIAAAAAATNVVVAPPALMASAGTPPPVRRPRALIDWFTSFYSPTPSPAATPNVSRSSSRMDLTTSASLLALDSALDSQPAFLTIEKLEEMASVVFKSAMSVQKNDDDDDASATQKARINAASQEVLALANTVRTVFSSPNSLASSFLTSTTTSDSATLLFDVDVDAVKKAYRLLLVDLAPHTTIRQALLDATELILARLEASAPSWSLSSCGKNARVLAPSIPTSQALRSITVKLRPIVALLCDPLILDGDQSDQLLRRLCSTMASLRRDVKSFTIEMLAAYFLADSKLFKRIIHAVKRLLCSRFVSHGRAKPDEGSVAAVRFLSMLYNVNEYAVKLSKTDGPSAEDYSDTADTEERHTYSIVPFSTFYCTVDSSDNDGMVLRRFDYKIEYIAWRKLNNAAGSSNTATASFSLLNYPFLFDPIAKARVLRVESMTSMTGGFEEAFVNNAFVTQAQKVLDGLDALERVPSMRVSVAADNDHDDDDEDAPSDVSGASADDGDHDDDDDEDKEVDGAQRNKTTRAPFDSAQLERAFEKVTVPYLVMEIRREHLVEDAIAQITAKAGDLHKPLKIKFVGGGEEGLDQGGVQKEFFQIILEQLLCPDIGVFSYDTTTRLSWINAFSVEPPHVYELFGVLLGLALYNGVMVDVQFPDVFYKKLLFEDGSDTGHKGTLRPVHGSELVELDDLKQLFPALHRGLTQLLLWDAERDGGSVEDVFCRNFEISYDIYGDIKTYPLVDGGAELPVTEDNRMEYSQRYVEHLLSTSVAKPFGAIRQGFWKVMAGTSTALLKRGGSAAMRNGSRPQVAVQLLRPEELRLMLTGLSTSEQRALYSAEAFAALRVNAGYVEYNGVTDRVIRWFWDIVLEEFTDEQRRKLLWFVTASDRVPLGGLKEVVFVLQKNGMDDARIPTAYTCFGRLLLPDYSSRAVLRRNLSRAIEESKGFGLI